MTITETIDDLVKAVLDVFGDVGAFFKTAPAGTIDDSGPTKKPEAIPQLVQPLPSASVNNALPPSKLMPAARHDPATAGSAAPAGTMHTVGAGNGWSTGPMKDGESTRKKPVLKA